MISGIELLDNFISKIQGKRIVRIDFDVNCWQVYKNIHLDEQRAQYNNKNIINQSDVDRTQKVLYSMYSKKEFYILSLLIYRENLQNQEKTNL